MNNDLIRRSDTLKAITNDGDEHWWYEERINEVPAVDAVEEVHSRWELVTTKWVPPQLVRVGYCQNCNEERPVDNYCPYCGAKMGGERKE